MPLVECKYGPVSTEVMGQLYTFTADEFGRNVAEGWNVRHIEAVTAVEHYRVVPKEPVDVKLTSIEPDTAVIGDPDVKLVCIGEGFLDDSVIVFNEGIEATTYVSGQELTTIVRPSTASVAGS